MLKVCAALAVAFGCLLLASCSSAERSEGGKETSPTAPPENGSTVDSQLDTPDADVGNGICADGSGSCTLRAALQEANAHADASTILFNISGTADFTNGSQDGYSIRPTSPLPNITSPLTIDGYSQPGARANTATAPNPLNGTLLVEINGTRVGDTSGLSFSRGSDNSVVDGLIINNFGTTPGGQGISLGATNVKIQGNYIGTNYDGTSAAPNGAGIGSASVTGSARARIGGLSAGERNLISGNHDFGLSPGNGWVIEGNYVGVRASGVTEMGNSAPDGSGGITIDDNDGVVVGGTVPGATNVISGNLMYGVSPVNTTNLTIQGNLIGTDYTGTKSIPNLFVGILAGGTNTNIQIGGTTAAARNLVSGNGLIGILVAEGTTGVVEGNYVGVDKSGQRPVSNGRVGVELGMVRGVTVGGTTPSARNVISANGVANVVIVGITGPADDNVIEGNYIGTDSTGAATQEISAHNGGGVLVYGSAHNNLIGGAATGSANRIAGNKGYGVSVARTLIPAFAVDVSPTGTAVIGNVIAGNDDDTSHAIATGSGIDLAQVSIQSQAPQFPYLPDMFGPGFGPTPNDATDSDSGANNAINFPDLKSVAQSGNQAIITFSLDAAESPTGRYRVEFFANDSGDPSGHGEGQTFLGYATVSNGNDQRATISLPADVDLAKKSISATTTAIDASRGSGFGSTSEFSAELQLK